MTEATTGYTHFDHPAYPEIRKQILKWVQQDEEAIVDFFSRLVKCPTPSDIGDTREAMKLVKEFLHQKALAHEEITADAIMPNLLSSFQAPEEGRHLMFNGHLDVIPAGTEPG